MVVIDRVGGILHTGDSVACAVLSNKKAHLRVGVILSISEEKVSVKLSDTKVTIYRPVSFNECWSLVRVL